jgi:hypothetical protein
MAMTVSWDGFVLDTPDWNALYFIDQLLRHSQAPHYEVLTAARTQSPDSPHPNGPKVVALQDNDDLVVAIVCVARAPHTTWTTIIISGTDGAAGKTEKGNLTSQIQALHLN